jgi:hypothetical protein
MSGDPQGPGNQKPEEIDQHPLTNSTPANPPSKPDSLFLKQSGEDFGKEDLRIGDIGFSEYLWRIIILFAEVTATLHTHTIRKQLLRMLASPLGEKIIDYFTKFGCGFPEVIEERTEVSHQVISIYVDVLHKAGLVKDLTAMEHMKVKPHKPRRDRPGNRQPKLWGLFNATLEQVEAARGAYFDYYSMHLKAKHLEEEAEEHRIRLEAKEEEKRRREEVETWAGRVLALLPPDTQNLSPIYEALREVDVPPELREKVKDLLIEMQVRKVPRVVDVDADVPSDVEAVDKDNVDPDLEERGYEAIISKAHDGDVWESEAKAVLEPLFPRGIDRIKFLDKINVRLFKSGIRLWRGK